MGKKIGLSMHPRKFDNHLTPQACQCEINQSTGMATQMQHGVFWPPRLFKREKRQQSQVRLNFKDFTDMDNREIAKALD